MKKENALLEKYLKAITDKNEKKEITTLFGSQSVTLVLGAVLMLATLIVGAITASSSEKGNPLTVVFYVLLVLACLAMFLHFSVRTVISSKMSLILRRPLRDGETQELLDYRKKLYAEMKADKAAFRKNAIPAIVGAVVFVVLLMTEIFLYPEMTSLGAISMTGFAVFVVGVVATIVLCTLYDRKKEKSGKGDKDGTAQGPQN